ncbi:hypothetical protein [Moraxella lacunata]|uniref:hypothetical protein n=1 Tax=Moraxella lacunata TaxID=477 RepID=UPI003EDF558D
MLKIHIISKIYPIGGKIYDTSLKISRCDKTIQIGVGFYKQRCNALLVLMDKDDLGLKR